MKNFIGAFSLTILASHGAATQGINGGGIGSGVRSTSVHGQPTATRFSAATITAGLLPISGSDWSSLSSRYGICSTSSASGCSQHSLWASAQSNNGGAGAIFPTHYESWSTWSTCRSTWTSTFTLPTNGPFKGQTSWSSYPWTTCTATSSSFTTVATGIVVDTSSLSLTSSTLFAGATGVGQAALAATTVPSAGSIREGAGIKLVGLFVTLWLGWLACM